MDNLHKIEAYFFYCKYAWSQNQLETASCELYIQKSIVIYLRVQNLSASHFLVFLLVHLQDFQSIVL